MRNRAIRGQGRRGSALLEFAFMGIPVMCFTISIVEVGLSMWQFHALTNTVTVAARYAASHGASCGQNGNTCTIQVKDVANNIVTTALALNSSLLNVTLTTNGATVTCNPITICQTNTAQFPSSSDNAVGMDITITATYFISNAMPIIWLPNADRTDSGYTLGAKSRQRIQF